MIHYRTDVVGSLLRPAALKAARAEYEARNLTDQAFKQIEDRAVDDAIAQGALFCNMLKANSMV